MYGSNAKSDTNPRLTRVPINAGKHLPGGPQDRVWQQGYMGVKYTDTTEHTFMGPKPSPTLTLGSQEYP